VSSRARPGCHRIGDHLLVDHIGQSPFQRPHGLHGGLALGPAAVVVAATLGIVAQLDDGHDVQDPVDAPVAGPGEPVAALLAR
jgi:hypothetical protein